jgi:hypothetical protein
MLDNQFAPGKYQIAGNYPIETSTTSPMFPPVCLKSHWDPTAILRRTLPDVRTPLELPVSFRPNTRICMQYVNAGAVTEVPDVPAQVVFPAGGERYPQSRYRDAIDRESELRRLDRKLGGQEYIPPHDSDMYTYRKISVPRKYPDMGRVSELEVPRALLRDGMADPVSRCRQMDDMAALSKSTGHVFGYPTKMAKYADGGSK